MSINHSLTPLVPSFCVINSWVRKRCFQMFIVCFLGYWSLFMSFLALKKSYFIGCRHTSNHLNGQHEYWLENWTRISPPLPSFKVLQRSSQYLVDDKLTLPWLRLSPLHGSEATTIEALSGGADFVNLLWRTSFWQRVPIFPHYLELRCFGEKVAIRLIRLMTRSSWE